MMPQARCRSWLLLLLIGVEACRYDEIVAPGELSTGTWGGRNAGVIVNDQVAHVHIGCTNGDFPVPVDTDDEGKFIQQGEYVLRAFPIQIGPSLPAQFAGHLSGRTLTLTVAVDDTVQKKQVVLGPVQVTLGMEPQLGPCPICRMPSVQPLGIPFGLEFYRQAATRVDFLKPIEPWMAIKSDNSRIRSDYF